MEKSHMPPWGTCIERGIIVKKESAGGVTRYDVASYDRAGVVACGIRDAFGNDHAMNDRVCFFLFPDGTGQILTAAGE